MARDKWYLFERRDGLRGNKISRGMEWLRFGNRGGGVAGSRQGNRHK